MTNDKELRILVAALRASSNPTVIALLAANDLGGLTNWLNDNSTTKAWIMDASKRTLFEAMKITTYDAVPAGKKEAWRLMLDLVPIDFTQSKMRKAITEIFDVADANAMLADFTEWASRAEDIVGGDSATTGTVTAIKRKLIGEIGSRELKDALK